MRIMLTILCVFSITWMAQAQNLTNYWSDISESQISHAPLTDDAISIQNARTLSVDLAGVKVHLANAPMEFTKAAKNQVLAIDLPMPNGQMETFQVVESPVMPAELGARYPDIKSYKIWSAENPAISGRMDLSYLGFNAFIRTDEGRVFISPYSLNHKTICKSYYRKDVQLNDEAIPHLGCGLELGHPELDHFDSPVIDYRNPEAAIELREYVVAISATGEFSQTFGGTIESVMSAINTALNTLNAIFEIDIAARFTLLPINDQIIWLDPNSDPFTDADNAGAVLSQNPTAITNIAGIPPTAYDFGHGFTGSCNGGAAGVASLGSVCRTDPSKASASSCFFSSNAAFWAGQIAAHEVGHQFTATHSWNNCPGNEDNLSSGTAYEPGSGSTIMSYSGACGSQNITNNSDQYFHVSSLVQMIGFSRTGNGNNCPTIIPTDNNEPSVSLDYENDFYVPISTPFELIANASDPDGDDITFCWEQYDLGPDLSPIGNPSGDAPLFRSYQPVDVPIRVFPKLTTILANQTDDKEVLPSYSRNMTFRCTVRDNFAGSGGTVWEEVNFEATESAGPFRVTSPNTSDDLWVGGTAVEVTWNVANTDNDLVNCQTVNILLSTNGGFEYPITLAENTLNDGSEIVFVPNITSTSARVRVEAADNIFFDLSNANFTIEEATQPGISILATPDAQVLCLPVTTELDIVTESILDFSEDITFEVLGGLPENANASFSQNPVTPSESTTLSLDLSNVNVEGNYTVEIQATADGLDPIIFEIDLLTFSNNFEDLAMVAPEDGNATVGLSADFEWTAIEDAITYDFQIATNPGFGASKIDEALGLSATTYTPDISQILFEENTLYFWRVRPVNECGPGPWLEPFTFHTASIACAPSQADDVPINISGTGTPTITSTLFVPESGIISDINIPAIKAEFQPVNSLRITLISPIGTKVVLFDQDCGNTLKLELGFDDEAPSEIVCPPDDGIVFQPIESLSAFDGENTQGTWQLEVKVVEPGFGASGGLEDWSIEFCSSVSPINPVLINNDTLFVPPGETNFLNTSNLEVTDEDNTPTQIRYTVVTPPAHGTLFRGGDQIYPGSSFTQASINTFVMSYTHDGGDNIYDSFTFVVTDGTGGYIPTQTFNIKIEEGVTVNTSEIALENGISLFPNPTDQLVNVQFENPIDEEVVIQVLNIQGQLLNTRRFNGITNSIQLPTDQLAAGVYFVNIQSGELNIAKKLMIHR